MIYKVNQSWIRDCESRVTYKHYQGHSLNSKPGPLNRYIDCLIGIEKFRSKSRRTDTDGIVFSWAGSSHIRGRFSKDTINQGLLPSHATKTLKRGFEYWFSQNRIDVVQHKCQLKDPFLVVAGSLNDTCKTSRALFICNVLFFLDY